MDFVIIINDAGELKSVTAADLRAWAAADMSSDNGGTSKIVFDLDDALNSILDRRAVDAGEYDPADNDTPITVTGGGA